MELQLEQFKITMQDGENCILKDIRRVGDIAEYDFLFTWTKESAAKDDGFTVVWSEPIQGVMYKWDASCSLHRDMAPHWNDLYDSMLSTYAPIGCMFDGTEQIPRYGGSCKACPRYWHEVRALVQRALRRLQKQSL